MIITIIYFSLISKDPGGLADYITAEYIPDFLGGPCEVHIYICDKNLLRDKYLENLAFPNYLNWLLSSFLLNSKFN